MAIEVGNVLEGRVTGVKPFGAFVALPEGKSGMVHISEVSNEYVQDINTVLHDGDAVKVQVINIAPTARSRCPSSGCCRRHLVSRAVTVGPGPAARARTAPARAAISAIPAAADGPLVRVGAALPGMQHPVCGSPRPRPRAIT